MTNPIPMAIPNHQPPTPEPRARANRANALLSTGPRTAAGKQRSSQNALTHGLTAASPVLTTENPAAYQLHCRQFFDEYQPATPTESQLTRELADTAWRLNRIPALEAALLNRAATSKSVTSKKPRLSSNSININAFPTTQPNMGSFFQKTESKHSRNA
jgi:hypothetical protein